MFGHKSSFQSHVETIHQNLKPFQSKMCIAAFGQRSVLNVHVKTVHEKLKPFQSRS